MLDDIREEGILAHIEAFNVFMGNIPLGAFL